MRESYGGLSGTGENLAGYRRSTASDTHGREPAVGMGHTRTRAGGRRHQAAPERTAFASTSMR